MTATHLPRENDESREVRAADFDGDGDLDLVVGNVRFVLDEPEVDTLLLNDGKGMFTPAPAGSLPPAGDASNFTIQAVDLDGDADLDVIAPSTVFERAAGDYRVLLNDGKARFSVAARGSVLPPSADGNGFDVEVADFDGDGRADLFLCNRASMGTTRNGPAACSVCCSTARVSAIGGQIYRSVPAAVTRRPSGLRRQQDAGAAGRFRQVLVLRQRIDDSQHGFLVMQVLARPKLERGQHRGVDVDELDRRMLGQ